MSDKARIAEIVLAHQWRGEILGCNCGWNWTEERTYFCGEEVRISKAHADHVAAKIDAALHPVIESVEQLDALPFTAVVRETYVVPSGRDYGKVWERWLGDGDAWVQVGYSSDQGFSSGAIRLPARVLYCPESP